MKNALLISALFLASSSAFASFYQVECSDASGKIRTSWGHVSNSLVFTEQRSGSGGVVESETQLPIRDVDVETLETVQIDQESSRTCREGGSGFWQSTTVEAQKVSISKADGSLFPEGTYGATQDRTAIEAYMICENHKNGQIFCEDD